MRNDKDEEELGLYEAEDETEEIIKQELRELEGARGVSCS